MKPRRIIDMHHHLPAGDAPGYARQLAAMAEACRIHKILLAGIEWPGQHSFGRNADVLECWRECPDLIVPFAGIDRDWPPIPARVDALKDAGFVGLKFIHPRLPYHDERLYPWYDRAQALGMPVLFHVGIVGRYGREDPDRVDNNLMRPIYLDTIARAFPNLLVLGAHLGNPWYEEAAMSCRWNPNLYYDLSGSTLKKKSPAHLNELLWWGGDTAPEYRDAHDRGAWDKIVFGSDVGVARVPNVIADYRHVAETLQWPDEQLDKVFYRTAATILAQAGVELEEKETLL